MITRKHILFLFITVFTLLITAACSSSTSGADEGLPSEITLDYAYYSPTSLVVKEFGWLEEEFAEEGVEIEFVLSQGSNRALEFLNSNSIDFGSTAGAAALMAKGNNAAIKNVYIYSQPEWTALVTSPESNIQSIEDLAGKTVAATLGTDPYIFLVRALNEHGLTVDDVEVINLQHSDGANALATGQVEAWAGLDPHMARQELETGAELFFRETSFNTYGFLNVREQFAEDYPEVVERVIEVYEKARKWVLENPEETVEIMAKEAQMDESVADLQLERNNFANPIPGSEHVDSLTEAGLVLQEAGVMDEEHDIEKLVESLIDPAFAENVID
ncbi:aliphatic sulfonate ABC transporter substrate-binding protein [Bacillus shivajii]|uniref:aliphatic sulfonate ABC transporter substrate-binding protein n=1 Tax=Bacillus shivajii TaxID=1983719 RepID=UPI001CF9D893|nr:aliphatic sulfonate ABC transporter substrate-binding protein [Bacillus shivajii]UCZ52383.1 aliphatic sulfonate ABC transporter substrate-binding protein [Bacillus shivajii]